MVGTIRSVQLLSALAYSCLFYRYDFTDMVALLVSWPHPSIVELSRAETRDRALHPPSSRKGCGEALVVADGEGHARQKVGHASRVTLQRWLQNLASLRPILEGFIDTFHNDNDSNPVLACLLGTPL